MFDQVPRETSDYQINALLLAAIQDCNVSSAVIFVIFDYHLPWNHRST